MFKIESTIDLNNFEKKYNRFMKEIEIEMRIALVNTREDFITRVASIVGTVPAAGGDIPSPYIATYEKLSSNWIEIKRTKGYMSNIGTATGDLLNWLIGFSKESTEVKSSVGIQEIKINLDNVPESIQDKVYMMESGHFTVGNKNYPRPIFSPVVIWYATLEGRGISPFYLEAIKARDRAIERVYGS